MPDTARDFVSGARRYRPAQAVPARDSGPNRLDSAQDLPEPTPTAREQMFARCTTSSTSSAVRQALSKVRAADSGEGQRGRWALALPTGPQVTFKDALSAAGACPGRRSQATPAAKATLTASLGGCQRLARWRQGRKLKTAASSGYPRRCPPRTRRLLSDPLARTSYGWQDGTWSFP